MRHRHIRLVGAIALLSAIVATGLVAAPARSGAVGGAQSESTEMPGEWMVLRAAPEVTNTSIPAPAGVDGGIRAAQAVFQVNYDGFPTEARLAFQAAVDIWASLVSSPVPIVIDASWEPLDPGVLGGARATNAFRNFTEAPQSGTWFVAALANARSGSDIRPAESDITALFASTGVTWYFGTDGHPSAGQYDFMTAVLHEIGHGLGFTMAMNVSLAGVGSWGADLYRGSPYIYDRFTHNGSGTGLLSYPNFSVSLGSELESNNVFFSGTFANAANGGPPIKLYAPSTWDPGSSISHFDDATFPPGNPNSLMTHALAQAESIHAPGPDALGVLQDIGWTVSTPAPPPDVPVQRISGQDAIGTSLATSQTQFGALSADAVVLARSDHFADALAGGPLAALQNAPLLITPGAPLRDTLDPRVLTEIQRVLAAGKTIYILGGPLAIAPGIDATLQAQSYAVVRVQGANQYATAVAIAGQLGNPDTVFEATGLHFADSLSAVPAAIQAHGAILLTNGAVQAPETAAYLAAHPFAVRYAIGGPLAAAGADPGAIAVWGQDLFGTSAAVAQGFFLNATTFGAATGFDFPDALSGGVFMGHPSHLGPMLLVTPHLPIPTSIADYLTQATHITHGYLFGGPLAVGDDVAGAL